MAEVDFGDFELFQQLDDDAPPVATHIRFASDGEGDEEEIQELKNRLGKCEETIESLAEENRGLKRKLSVLTRPGGLTVDNVQTDGPLLQVLFANNSISKQCRQEIEDCICSVVRKHRDINNGVFTSSKITPQSSSFDLEEDEKVKTSCGIKTIKEAFSMVGSVLYFTTFCLDKLGHPLLNDNPQLTDGWEVPTYQQVFNQVIAPDGVEVQATKEKRPKAVCFNCGGSDHQLRDCPQPKDQAKINEMRKEFSQGNNQPPGGRRYHAEEVEERFAKYKAGVLSEDLQAALGLDGNKLPPFIYRMRQLGYPPGWLKEAEMENSGLALYDGNVSSDGVPTGDNGQKVSYDVSKLVDFPGFNVPAPQSVKDDYRLYGSVPMQQNHLKHNFAAYLSSTFPTPGSANKRRHESETTPQQTKKRRSNADSSDMDISGRRGRAEDASGASSGVGEEDALTLEELEEQQRMIWAALQNADTASNSDSETPVGTGTETPAGTGTPMPGSPSVSTPIHVLDTETEMEEGEEEKGSREGVEKAAGEECPQSPDAVKIQDGPHSPDQVKMEEESPRSPDAVKIPEKIPSSPDIIEIHDDSPQSPNTDMKSHDPKEIQDNFKTPEPVKMKDALQTPALRQGATEMDLSDSAGKVMSVPHRSKFQEGIVPFEETPEWTEVSEATGTYLKIRDLLKSSPRSLAKNKK